MCSYLEIRANVYSFLRARLIFSSKHVYYITDDKAYLLDHGALAALLKLVAPRNMSLAEREKGRARGVRGS